MIHVRNIYFWDHGSSDCNVSLQTKVIFQAKRNTILGYTIPRKKCEETEKSLSEKKGNAIFAIS